MTLSFLDFADDQMVSLALFYAAVACTCKLDLCCFCKTQFCDNRHWDWMLDTKCFLYWCIAKRAALTKAMVILICIHIRSNEKIVKELKWSWCHVGSSGSDCGRRMRSSDLRVFSTCQPLALSAVESAHNEFFFRKIRITNASGRYSRNIQRKGRVVIKLVTSVSKEKHSCSHDKRDCEGVLTENQSFTTGLWMFAWHIQKTCHIGLTCVASCLQVVDAAYFLTQLVT